MRPRSASLGDVMPPTSEDFMINGTGYMERQRESPSPTKGHYWGDTPSKRDGDDVIHHNNNNNNSKNKSEYITRLTSLRDSLINNEEANLAQALDRLRLHSITNKSHSNKLRMRPVDDFLSAPPLIHQRKNMVTTVERFRQIRPSRHQPVIFPLQGRQMLDMATPRPASEVPISNFGNSTNRSTRSQSEYMAPKPSHTKLEETVQANLQRLIQPTSSIPNIGRKALRHHNQQNQDGLEPKTKPLLNIRASLQKSHNGHHLVTPFLLNTNANAHEAGYDSDNNNNNNNHHHNNTPNNAQSLAVDNNGGGVENLSPQALKLSPVLQGDTIDMDKLSQYYQNLISDMEMNGEEGGRGGGGGGGGGGEGGRMGDNNIYYYDSSKSGITDNNNNNNTSSGGGNSKFFHYKVKYRHSPFKSSLAKGHTTAKTSSSVVSSEQGKRHYNSYNSVVSSSGKTIPFSELPNIAPRTSYAYPTDVISDYDLTSDHHHHHHHPKSHHVNFPEVQTSYRLPMSELDANSDISKWCNHGGRSLYRDNSKAEDDFNVRYLTNNNNNSGHNRNSNSNFSSSKNGRMKIVVDMPNIIFNAASPENEGGGGGGAPPEAPENDQGQSQGGSMTSNNTGMSLKKTVKQHELRQKELHNLLEDVKELNSWSEIAAKRSISEGT